MRMTFAQYSGMGELMQNFITINACVFALLAAIRIWYLLKVYAGNRVLREQALRLEQGTLYNIFKGPVTVLIISLSWIISTLL